MVSTAEVKLLEGLIH